MSLLVLSATDVDALVSTISPQDLQVLMARVFSRFSTPTGGNVPTTTGVSMPPRLSIRTPNHTALFMPARIGSLIPSVGDAIFASGETAVKVVCVPTDVSDSRGLPGTTMVLDEATGAAKAIVNSRKLTALRNAAGSLLSTSIIGPSKPERVVAFGAGQQIEAHLDLHIQYFPSITSCTIINRTINDRALTLKKTISDRFPDVAIELLSSNSNDTHHGPGNSLKNIEQSIQSADIIICATSSTQPLFPSSLVRTGTHIILIGSYKPEMREVDRDLIYRSLQPEGRLLVDSREACLREAGELIDAQVQPEAMSEIGALIPMDNEGNVDYNSFREAAGAKNIWNEPRGFNGPITLFKSVGLGIQDVAIASAVVEKAMSSGGGKFGTIISGYDA